MPALAAEAARLAALLQDTRAAVEELKRCAADDAEAPYWVAGEMLRLAGLCLFGWFWLNSARICIARGAGSGADPWLDGKLRAARYGMRYLLPESRTLLATIAAAGRP